MVGQFIDASVHRNTHSDDTRIDTRDEVSIRLNASIQIQICLFGFVTSFYPVSKLTFEKRIFDWIDT